MTQYKIKVHIELVECDDSINPAPTKNKNGTFSMTLSEQNATSIDMCEKFVLQTAYPAIREAVSTHLTEISKKKASKASKEKVEVVSNTYLYRVDGEIGRFTFSTHSVFLKGDKIYNTACDLFGCLQSVEFYKTTGFKDIAMIYGDTVQSYRKTGQLINRIRYQPEWSTPHRTLHECTEKEGQEILNHIKDKSVDILTGNGFSEEGICQEDKNEYHIRQPVTIAQQQVLATIALCLQDQDIDIEDIVSNPVPYEEPDSSTNVAIDDVNVKKQEELRPGGRKSERGSRKYVHNTIAYIFKKDIGNYILNGHGIKNVLLFLIAFFFYNGLIGNRIQFFTDGHTILNNSILKSFTWYKNIGIILDWFHLEKKCKEQLSMALKGRIVRNTILKELMPLLWFGLTDKAIAYIKEIPRDSIKNENILDKLIKYFQRNKPYIPCYAVRKELGLCNSSAIGEKMNDLVVADRQKHNGMSWSKIGSVSLATITALKRNKESDRWFEAHELDFKLAA